MISINRVRLSVHKGTDCHLSSPKVGRLRKDANDNPVVSPDEIWRNVIVYQYEHKCWKKERSAIKDFTRYEI